MDASPRVFERIAVIERSTFDAPNAVADPRQSYRLFDVGPCVEDGRIWIWQGDEMIAGDFATIDDAMVWFRKFVSRLHHPDFIRTRAFPKREA